MQLIDQPLQFYVIVDYNKMLESVIVEKLGAKRFKRLIIVKEKLIFDKGKPVEETWAAWGKTVLKTLVDLISLLHEEAF